YYGHGIGPSITDLKAVSPGDSPYGHKRFLGRGPSLAHSFQADHRVRVGFRSSRKHWAYGNVINGHGVGLGDLPQIVSGEADDQRLGSFVPFLGKNLPGRRRR